MSVPERHVRALCVLECYGTCQVSAHDNCFLTSTGVVGEQVLRLPLFQLPQLITQLVNARVAMVRLQEYLAAPQEPPAPMLPPAQKGALNGVSNNPT